jgi:hypothetical protein
MGVPHGGADPHDGVPASIILSIILTVVLNLLLRGCSGGGPSW